MASEPILPRLTTLRDRVDFAQLIKVYRAGTEGEARYSPAKVASTERVPVIRYPDPKRICTSIVERQNLSMRMGIRRLTRLTNGVGSHHLVHCDKLIDWSPKHFLLGLAQVDAELCEIHHRRIIRRVIASDMQ
jgi:hypothetical protein